MRVFGTKHGFVGVSCRAIDELVWGSEGGRTVHRQHKALESTTIKLQVSKQEFTSNGPIFFPQQLEAIAQGLELIGLKV